MIIVSLTGGLGNQMFQYSFGRALALEKNQKLILDFGGIEIDPNPTKFGPELLKFKLSKSVLKISSIFFSRCIRGTLKLISIFPLCSNFYQILRDNNEFQSEIFKNDARNIFINGWWQSDKYFKNVMSELLCDFESTYTLSDESKFFLSHIKKTVSVAVHVRRGDVVVSNAYMVKPSYYTEAAKIIHEKLGADVTFFIFSNEIDWARENVLVNENVFFVDCNDGTKSFEDFLLMTACQHFITAASTFSWWAAWLAFNRGGLEADRIIIAPSRWGDGASFNHSENPDHYPDGWKILKT
jgi:hypothetical protein